MSHGWKQLSESELTDLAEMVKDFDSPMPVDIRADLLRDPMFLVKAFARVKNFKGQDAPANFDAVDPNLSKEIDAFVRQPAEDEESTWVCSLKYRQGARSTNYELAGLAMCMYRPGWLHACIGDTANRAEMLHDRIHYAYDRWPANLKTSNYSAKEKTQLTLDNKVGGTMMIMSAASAAAGIGLSIDSLHASEVGYWVQHNNPDVIWSELYPALAARPHSRVAFECTPTEAGSWWHDFCLSAKAGEGRFRYFFTPFHVSRISKKKWDPDKEGKPTNEEYRLLERYGPEGMTLEHLAFRRDSMRTVTEFKRDPASFFRAYPVNDVECWGIKTSNSIPHDAMAKHMAAVLVKWKGPYQEYAGPVPGGLYVIGVDPSGYTTGVTRRDHAAFHVWQANRHAEEQVASYAEATDPDKLARRLVQVGERYNNALIVVEANGVGAATLAALRHLGYRNLYYRQTGEPGWNNNPKTLDEAMGFLVTFLQEPDFRIRDENTIDQLLSYNNDKKMEGSETSEIRAAMRRVKAASGKRERSHWAKVSALFSVIVGLRSRQWPSLAGEIANEPHRVEEKLSYTAWMQMSEHAAKMRATSGGNPYDPRLSVLTTSEK